MSKAIETEQQSAASVLSVRSLEATRSLVSCVETASYALQRRQILSIIAVCSIVWLASVWLAASLAQAQESSSNGAVTATEPATGRRSIEKAEVGNLVLSMVDRSDLERSTPGNSTILLTNPRPTGSLNGARVLLPSNPRATEYASLAALASAPPSSLLNSIQAKSSGQADSSSLRNDNKAFVYQLGTINLVINRLPNSFSVWSAGSSLSNAR
jgi:hypothetical protein